VKHQIQQQRSVVWGFGDSRSKNVQWLNRTDFPTHTSGLKDEELKGSCTLPPTKVLDSDLESDTENPTPVEVLIVVETVLRDAYQLRGDSLPSQKFTQQRVNISNEFYTGASGRADEFSIV